MLGVTTINYVSGDGTSFMNQANASAGLALVSFVLVAASIALCVHQLRHQLP